MMNQLGFRGSRCLALSGVTRTTCVEIRCWQASCLVPSSFIALPEHCSLSRFVPLPEECEEEQR